MCVCDVCCSCCLCLMLVVYLYVLCGCDYDCVLFVVLWDCVVVFVLTRLVSMCVRVVFDVIRVALICFDRRCFVV